MPAAIPEITTVTSQKFNCKEKIGFSIGDTVAVEYSENAIIIRPLTSEEKHELTYTQLEKNIKKQTAILETLKVAENSDCYNQ